MNFNRYIHISLWFNLKHIVTQLVGIVMRFEFSWNQMLELTLILASFLVTAITLALIIIRISLWNICVNKLLTVNCIEECINHILKRMCFEIFLQLRLPTHQLIHRKDITA